MNPTLTLEKGDFLQNGKYEILDKIGQGGFGITYLARHSVLKVEIAIKELFLSSQSTYCTRNQTDKSVVPFFDQVRFDEFKKHFLNEAYTLARFKGIHGIVQVIDTFEENGTVYFVMEYIDGKSVKKMVESNGTYPEEKAKEIVIRLLDALGEVHKKGVLHRDINPNNILIDKSGQPVLIDFGIAREYQEDITQTHTTFRTANYSAPEQALVRVKRGAYTDIYSIGGTLYFMLTGNPPQSSDEIDLEGFVSPKQINPGISEALNLAVIKAIRRKPAERFQSCDEFRQALISGKIDGVPTFSDADDKTIIDDQQSRQKTVDHKTQEAKPAVSEENSTKVKPAVTAPPSEKIPSPKPTSKEKPTHPETVERPGRQGSWGKKWIIVGGVAAVVFIIAVIFGVVSEKQKRDRLAWIEKARQDSIRFEDSVHKAQLATARLQAYNDSVASARAYASSPEGKARKLLIGKHLFSSYFVGSDEQFGKVTITDQNGKLVLDGSHKNNNRWVNINGYISKIIDERKFEFTGTIQAHNPSEGADCTWSGTTTFWASGSRVYWRTQDQDCFSHTGDMDIYFTAGGM